MHTSPYPTQVQISEVGPRDGLQNQSDLISTDDKVAFVDALSETGVSEIEVSSFVSPKAIPQLADAAEVFRRIKRNLNVIYSALVPNMRGLQRALDVDADKIGVVTAASNTFSQKNVNANIAESIRRIEPVVVAAKDAGKPVRGYISCVIACPYEGDVSPRVVADLCRTLLDLGVDEIDLCETFGVAAPTGIRRLYEEVGGIVNLSETILHMHDTYGTGLACMIEAMRLGVRRFDASCGGLGGCPYAPGATGNLATEDAVYCLTRMGIETGIDLDRLIEAGRGLETALKCPLTGRVYLALTASQCRVKP